MGETLVIRKGEGFKIKVEKSDEFKDSFFSEVYDEAYSIVQDIVNASKQVKENSNKSHTLEDEYNNIIAFLGERGTGKSSILTSFVNSLMEADCIKKKVGENKKFHVLHTIDPSNFEENDSVLEVVLASMFMKFRNALNDNKNEYNMEYKRELLESFQMVYDSLRILKCGKNKLYEHYSGSDMTIEMISKMASGTDIKNQIKKLVQNYLKFMEKSNGDSFLVIPIDDIDMNIQYSAPMTEEIRKYMMIPNVIIVMAAKLEQLKDTIEKSYRKNFKELTNNNGKISENPEEMTNRYIEKLMPNGRKLFLPEIKVFKESRKIKLKIYDNEGEVVHDGSKLELQESLFKIIHQKTGLIFIKPEYGVHYLIPDTIRELQGFVQMLLKMDDVYNDTDKSNFITERYNDNEKKKTNEINANKGNLKAFKDYFVNSWTKRNLNKEYENVVKDFVNISNDYKNKFIVKELRCRVDKIISENLSMESILLEDESWKRINIITNIFNRGENISLGDVIFLFDKVERYIGDMDFKLRKYIFALKTLYSIEIYNVMFLEKTESERLKFMQQIIKGDIFGCFLEEYVDYKMNHIEKMYVDISDYTKIDIDEKRTLDDYIKIFVRRLDYKVINELEKNMQEESFSGKFDECLEKLLNKKNNTYAKNQEKEEGYFTEYSYIDLKELKTLELLKLSLEYGYDYKYPGDDGRRKAIDPFYKRSFFSEDEVEYDENRMEWRKKENDTRYRNAKFNVGGIISKIFYMDMNSKYLIDGLKLNEKKRKEIENIVRNIIRSRVIYSYEDRIVLPLYSLEYMQEYLKKGSYVAGKILHRKNQDLGYIEYHYKPILNVFKRSADIIDLGYINKHIVNRMKKNLNYITDLNETLKNAFGKGFQTIVEGIYSTPRLQEKMKYIRLVKSLVVLKHDIELDNRRDIVGKAVKKFKDEIITWRNYIDYKSYELIRKCIKDIDAEFGKSWKNGDDKYARIERIQELAMDIEYLLKKEQIITDNQV